jgi:hypothetical protein
LSECLSEHSRRILVASEFGFETFVRFLWTAIGAQGGAVMIVPERAERLLFPSFDLYLEGGGLPEGSDGLTYFSHEPLASPATVFHDVGI